MTADSTDTSKAQRDRLYEAQTLKYQDGAHNAHQEFDRAILTLSASSLGVSLAFIKDIVPLDKATLFGLLFVSWVFFAGAMILTLMSFLASFYAFEHAKQALFAEYYGGSLLYTEPTFASDDKPVRQSLWARSTRYMTYASGLCFLSGISLTLAFAIGNIMHLNPPSSTIKNGGPAVINEHLKKDSTQEPMGKGIVPSGPIKVPESRLSPPSEPGTQPPQTAPKGHETSKETSK